MVVGIIAILIAILLPALNKARDQAKRAACLSNLRQLGQISHLYAAENRGWFPYRSQFSPWPAQAMWSQNGSGLPAPDPTGIGDMRKLWARYVSGFRLGEPGTDDPNGRPSPIMYCPATDGTDVVNRIDNNNWPGKTGFPESGFYLVGYSYFGNYGNGATGAMPGGPTTVYMGGRVSIGKPVYARKNKDKSSIPLWGDTLEDKSFSPGQAGGTYWYNAHTRAGATQFSKIPPLGIHCVTVDGSARWYAWSADPQKSELEYFIRKFPGSNPGFMWGKPNR